ncbi:CLUMA_CG006099, isoform A [Clunio marinus]|uniref:CLUMA_CG006099, isoform A n=1 Tax=Clunio marinus TaxID=568069 RepID=A0A1J1HX00_9DIPT|nr:CLUMA_CG006099, isoform A [Clunio marinus]
MTKGVFHKDVLVILSTLVFIKPQKKFPSLERSYMTFPQILVDDDINAEQHHNERRNDRKRIKCVFVFHTKLSETREKSRKWVMRKCNNKMNRKVQRRNPNKNISTRFTSMFVSESDL